MRNFQLVNKKNEILVLAAILVIAFGYMAYKITYSKKIVVNKIDDSEIILNDLSKTEDVVSIENDLNDTDVDNIDKELQDIEKALNEESV